MSLRLAPRVRDLRRTLIRELFESAPPGALNLGLGQPDIEPPRVLREALAKAALDGPGGYGPTAGDPALRDAIGSSYAPFASDAGAVVVAAGCQQATFLALGALVGPGDEVLVPDPGFPGAARAAEAWGAEVRRYPLHAERGFHLDVDELARLVTDRTRALVLISPSNPTGTCEPRTTVDALIALTARRGIALIIDDTYRTMYWLGNGDAPTTPSTAVEHVVIVGGLSKSLALTGWRVGWVVAPDRALIDKLIALQQTLLTCPPTPTQVAARIAFEEAGQRAMGEVRRIFQRRRDLVAERLNVLGSRLAPLEGAFYAFLDVGAAGGGMAFARRLIDRHRIVTIPGEAFGVLAANWLRISYAQPDEQLGPAMDVVLRELRASEA